MQTRQITSPRTRAQPRSTPLGLRLPPEVLPTASWNPWQVVERAHGFHVSRESISGAQTEFLRNDVRGVKIFRSPVAATKACEQANFTAKAASLSREPLLGGKGAAT